MDLPWMIVGLVLALIGVSSFATSTLPITGIVLLFAGVVIFMIGSKRPSR